MSAGVYNFILNQGTDHHFLLTYTDKDGAPKDITNIDFIGEIRLHMGDSDVFAYMNFEKVDPVQGQLKVLIPSYETEGKRLNSTRYDDYITAVYDIESIDGDTGEKLRILQGNINISPEVTR